MTFARERGKICCTPFVSREIYPNARPTSAPFRAGEHEHVISGYSLLKGIGDGEPIASDRFTVGGHEWVLLFYPDGKRSISETQQAPPPNDDPYAALFVALIGEGPRPQGVVHSSSGRVVRAFHRFTLVDQTGTGNRDITKGRQRDQGAVKISCARQDPNARNCHGYRKFVRRSVLENPQNGYLVDDTIVIRYEIELVVTNGGALHRINKANPLMSIDVSSFPTLGDEVRKLLTDDADKTDCVFEVEGEKFPAHSLIMSARSSAFRAMLRTGAEMREGSEGVVRLSDIRSPVFKLLMHFIYSDELPDGSGRGPVTDNGYRASGPGRANAAGALASHASGGRRATGTEGEPGTPSGTGNSTPPDLEGIDLDVAMTQHLLVAADRYDLTRLRAICESRLCDMVDVETAATTLALAEQNHAHALKRACLEYVALHLAEVMQTDGYKHMEQSCPQLASELLRTVAMRDTTQQQQANAMANANAASIHGAPLALGGAGDVGFGGAQPSPTPAAVAGGTGGGHAGGMGAGGTIPTAGAPAVHHGDPVGLAGSALPPQSLAAMNDATADPDDVATGGGGAGNVVDDVALDAVDADDEIVAITAGAGAGARGAQGNVQPDGSTAAGRRVRRRTSHHHN